MYLNLLLIISVILNVLFIIIIFILTKQPQIKDMADLTSIFDFYIDKYKEHYRITTILYQNLTNDTVVSKDEFRQRQKEFISYIWNSMPNRLKQLLVKHFGFDAALSYISVKINPILVEAYKINDNLKSEANEDES